MSSIRNGGVICGLASESQSSIFSGAQLPLFMFIWEFKHASVFAIILTAHLLRGDLRCFPAGMPELDEYTMERVLEEFEQRCYDNMNHAIETEEGLGIEYDEDVVCDVCQSPDGEDGNEMVFCDKCNICVHQVSGAAEPRESWVPFWC